MNSLRLLALLPRSPQEFVDRTLTILSGRWEAFRSAPPSYRIVDTANTVRAMRNRLQLDLDKPLQEPACAAIEFGIRERQQSLPIDAPFRIFHNGGPCIASLCYALVRALQPEVVVETGVCYGVTSAYFLKALDVNGHGHLHSIDLPPLGKDGDAYVGTFVPRELRHRWTLHRGTTRRLLPPLVASLGQIDLFLHDSLHTYQNMRSEFLTVWPAMRPGGVLIADDVEGNVAFQQLSRLNDTALALVCREPSKGSLFGVAVKGQ